MASATSPTSIESMGSRLRTRTLASPLGPIGRHRTGSVGPKTTTPGAPTAAARCDTPESFPTNPAASRATAATIGKSRSFSTGTPAARKMGSIEVSAGPRMTTTLAHFHSASFDASAANLSAGQFLPGLPLPGKITIKFELSHFDSANTREAAARSSGIGSSRVSFGKPSSPIARK